MSPRDSQRPPSITRKRTLSITEAAADIDRVLHWAQEEGPVYLTRDGRTEGVVLSHKAYQALLGLEPVDLEQLEREYDSIPDSLFPYQPSPGTPTQESATGLDRVFAMTEEEMGEALRKGMERERRNR